MTFDAAKTLLEEQGQAHVLRFWDSLDQNAQSALLTQIDSIDFDSISQMQGMLIASDASEPEAGGSIEPSPVIDLATLAERDREENLAKVGCEALATGKVGVILVAGGQGSRLGFDGPKGAYKVGPLSEASLFEIHARKILALERKYDAQIPFYIMTSQINDAPTRAFFAENDNFGLSSERVLFFTQRMWPALDGEGKLILDSPSHIFMSPDGHGGTLTALRHTGMFDDMDRRGLETVFYFQVDNPLVEIADPLFVGLHLKYGADISIKVCAKRDPEEGLGIVAEKNGKHMIVEYSELTPEQMHERLPNGDLKLRFGSVAIHLFSIPFMKQEAAAMLPLHVAHKKVPYVDQNGDEVKPEAPNAYKFEKFIFDVIPDAKVAVNVEFARENEFSPVKNATGNDSPEACQRDMILKYATWLEICGVSVPRDEQGIPTHRIEIDPCFALGPQDLKEKIEGLESVDGDLLLEEF